MVLLVLASAGVVILLPGEPEDQPDRAGDQASRGEPQGAPAPSRSAAPSRGSPAKKAEAAPRQRQRMAPARHRARLQAMMARLRKAQAATAAPPPATGAPPSGGADPDSPGKLSADYIRGAVKEITPLIKECYQMALAQDPELGGKLIVRFEIVGDPELGGLVAHSGIDEERSSATSASLRECVKETMYALELKPPEERGKVVVNYPFKFKTSAPSGATSR